MTNLKIGSLLSPIFFISLILLSAVIVADEPIVVRLATENQRLPLYLVSFIDDNSGFAPSYLKSLEQVFNFDLNHNGMTYTLPQNADRDVLAVGFAFDAPVKSTNWKELGAFYVVKVRIHDKKLSGLVFSANSDVIKHVDDWALTGDLGADRRLIHQLSDLIFRTLFDKEGIAQTHFLFTRKVSGPGDQWSSEVWEADYDGANARQLTTDSGYAVTPVYVPPKSGYLSGSFFFVSYKTGQPKIYYQSLKGEQSKRFSYLSGNQLMPAFSSLRDKVAFINDATGNPDLFVQDFDPEQGSRGKPYQVFASHRATQGTPSFSPDGRQISFVSNKDGSPRVYRMDVPAAGSSLKDIKVQLVSKHNRESSAPAWSPDGTKIAFCALTKGTRQIWVYDLEKNEERQLTQGPGNKENPSWAPNSLHLVFNSSDANACELYLINLNQPEVTKISSGLGEKRFPYWEPRP